ncbi:hypothetical protein ACS0TY_003388 [Phlomoides rotata]
MTHLESITSSAVRAALKVKASVIICFTSSGRAARLIAKYRPTMPVLSVVIPRLKTNQLKWSFSGAFEDLDLRKPGARRPVKRFEFETTTKN